MDLLLSDNSCKQLPLLGNARNIHACKNTTIGLLRPFLSNSSVNRIPRERTRTQQEKNGVSDVVHTKAV
jgi:hypothetical protein